MGRGWIGAARARLRAFRACRHGPAGGHRRSSGLGLAIARAYARRNDGDIELRDGEPNGQGGVGLASVLWLPLAPTVSPYPRTVEIELKGDQ